MRIGAIHATVPAVQPLMDTAAACYPDIQIVNYLNEYLLEHANAAGCADPEGLRMLAETVFAAAKSNLDGIVIACTIYAPYARTLQPFLEIPIIGMDDAMIEKAVREGKTVGIIGTTPPSEPAVREKMLAKVREWNMDTRVLGRTVTEAMKRLRIGDVQSHNELVRDAALELIREGCDTIVLSQITMARVKPLLDDTGVKVLTSPEAGLERIREIIMTSS